MQKIKYMKLRAKRIELGFSQRELIEELKKINVKISQGSYCKKERGEIPFSLEEALKLSEVLNSNVYELFVS